MKSTTNSVKNKNNISIKDTIMKYFGVTALILLIIVFTVIDNSFVNESNLRNLLSDTAPLMIMSAGMTFILLLGSIDLSMGAVCSVSNVIVVKLMVELTESMNGSPAAIFIAYLTAIAFGLGSGLLLGLVHVKLKVPSFIASLGFMSVWESVALVVSEAPVSVPKALWGAIDWSRLSLGVLGLPLVIAVILIVIFYILQTKSAFGKNVMAIGGNERAARICGVPVDKTKIFAFLLAGLCAALGGIFLAAKLKSSAPTVGESFTLLTIASVVLGGTALTGGRGSVLGTLIGVFVTSIIRNGMNIVGVDVFWQNIVFGLVVLGAVALTINRSDKDLVVK